MTASPIAGASHLVFSHNQTYNRRSTPPPAPSPLCKSDACRPGLFTPVPVCKSVASDSASTAPSFAYSTPRWYAAAVCFRRRARQHAWRRSPPTSVTSYDRDDPSNHFVCEPEKKAGPQRHRCSNNDKKHYQVGICPPSERRRWFRSCIFTAIRFIEFLGALGVAVLDHD